MVKHPTEDGWIIYALSDMTSTEAIASGASSLAHLEEAARRLQMRMRIVSYDAVLRDGLPPGGRQILVPFFPYGYWNSVIEVPSGPQPYGGRGAAGLLTKWLRRVDLAARSSAGDHAVFLNSPQSLAMSRDKVSVKERLTACNVSTPAWTMCSSPPALLAAIDTWEMIYVKARCGSNNKGISRLSKTSWCTNFRIAGRTLIAPSVAEHLTAGETWPFTNVRLGDPLLLSLLGSDDFIVEKAIVAGASRRECRVSVLSGVVTTCACVEVKSCWVTARERHGRAPAAVGITAETIAAIDEVALGAARALGLMMATIDVVLDEDNVPFAIDVQGFPPPGTSDIEWETALLSVVGRNRARPPVGPTLE